MLEMFQSDCFLIGVKLGVAIVIVLGYFSQSYGYVAT